MPRVDPLTQDSGDCCSVQDSNFKSLENSDPSSLPMPLHHFAGSSHQKEIQRIAVLHHAMTKPLSHLPMIPGGSRSTNNNITKSRIPKTNLLDSIPKEVLARDILGFLTDKGVKVFFDSLGEERIKSPSFLEIRNQFCQKHGSRLEDADSFVTSSSDNESTNNKHRGSQILSKPGSPRKRCCPECHAEQQNVKRCHGCKVFYPSSRDKNNSNKAFPGLWCQSCDHMAFCKTCLSNDNGGCGSAVLATTLQQAPASFGRKHRVGYNNNNNNNHFYNGRASCHNYCCSNVFTNTMCGEFVCLDCGDENQKRTRLDNNNNKEDEHLAVETCEECGKSTCLDPNCLVCADFKLIHMSCKFSPEDAYNVDITNLSPKVRRNLSDCLVWMLVFMALSKMWWFQQQQHQQQLQQEL